MNHRIHTHARQPSPTRHDRAPRPRERWAATAAALSLSLLAGCQSEAGVADQAAALRADCADSREAIDAGAWVCPASHTVECEGGDGTQDVDVIHLVAGEAELDSCDEVELTVNDPGPFEVGTHDIEVFAEGGPDASVDAGVGAPLCEAELIVQDTAAPELRPRELTLWPPNHRMHAIDVRDCVEVVDACDDDDDVELFFTHVHSDEPDDARGDGHTEPDIVIDDCTRVQLRAERQGGGDGRVYTLGVRAEDAAGNVTEGSCEVTVPHDQRGDDAVDSGAITELEVEACDDDDDGDGQAQD